MTEQSIEQAAARRLEQERAEAEESRLRELAAEEQQRREAERREHKAAEDRRAAVARCRELAEQRTQILDEIEAGAREVARKVAAALDLDREERGIRSSFGLPGQYAPPLPGIIREFANAEISSAFGDVTRDPRNGVPLKDRDPLAPARD